MKIWLINDYNMRPEHGHLNRFYYLGKYLKKLGHDPVAFVGSHPHNTNFQLINNNSRYKVFTNDPFPWVLIKTKNYEGHKFYRVLSMFKFYRNMKKSCHVFDKPDVIVGSSAHPLAALLAIKLGRKYHCQSIVEIRDLWPESIVAYGVLSRKNPIIKILYRFEKYLYVHADKLIFTMENAWAYFEDRGLDRFISKEKVFYLNNGVDLNEYKKNLENNKYSDDDLNDPETFKIVYTGSIRKVNNLGLLLDAAKLVKNSKVKILIWGNGDEVSCLKQRCIDENIKNVVFKGFVEKKYIASITTQADVNIMHCPQSSVFKYGLSANKIFDYAAAGKPIITDFKCGSNPVDFFNAGITIPNPTDITIASVIDDMSSMHQSCYEIMSENALKMAKHYSFENLAKKMIEIIEA